MRAAAKWTGDLVAIVLLLLPAAACWVEKRIDPDSEGMFSFWAHIVAFAPGPPGVMLRRAFYRLTLDRCARSFYMAIGAMFTHRHATVENGVYVGAYALVGCAKLCEGCLIGSRASLLSGPNLHRFEGGKWTEADLSRREQIEIGANAWIGEGAILMANVGPGAMVAAGSVVSTEVAGGVVVAGNPARFVRRLEDSTGTAAQPVAVLTERLR